MYQALYRKYRPKTFDDVVGQNVIIKTLTNSILNNKINHAYLFTGPRGTGKTSIAKILAKIVNCENLNVINPCNKCVNCTQINNRQDTDIIEIDAASNNGVDEIRDLRDKVGLVPSFGKYKVYIIDEVHMLTTAAFNALLKTLEEPPKHIIFILATTEPHKIPSTILSRCQRFDFKKISVKEIEKRLEYICEKEKILIDSDALKLISKLCDGGMRDAVGMLDQLTAYTTEKINIFDVNEVSGIITQDEICNFLIELSNSNLTSIFNLIETYDATGKNINKIIEEIIEFLKNTLIYYNDSSYYEDENQKNLYSKICKKITENKIYEIIDILLETLKNIKASNNTKLLFELSIIKIINCYKDNVVKKNIDIPILEEKNKIKIIKKVERPTFKKVNVEKLDLLKKIRITNTLANFDKKELISFKKELYRIEELLMNPDYSSIVSMILDGELKAKGKENLIFVYKIEGLDEDFNSKLIEIEQIFLKIFDKKYKPIAVSEAEWNPIKIEFNSNISNLKNKYIYKEENINLEDLYTVTDKTHENKIEEMFNENIVYN